MRYRKLRKEELDCLGAKEKGRRKVREIKMARFFHNKFFSGFLTVVSLSIVIVAASAFFLEQEILFGPLLILLGIVTLLPITFFHISLHSLWPDLVFGLIDNGVLVILALVGAHFAGVFGAIAGGVVGNALTDGLAGLFEGYAAEHARRKNISERRTAIGSALGKMAGCLLGAGAVLVIASAF